MLNKQANPIIIDTETTGFKAPQAVEVAYIELDKSISNLNLRFNSDFELEAFTYQERFKPSKPIDPGAEKVHGISMASLKGCRPTASFKLPEHSHFIAHQASFDHRVLGKPFTSLICTKQLAQIAFEKDHAEGKLRNHKLVTLIDYILPKEESKELIASAHGAMADCVMTWYLLVEILKRLDHIDSWESLAALCTQPKDLSKVVLKTMPFGKHKGRRFEDIDKSYLEWLLSTNPSQDIKNSLAKVGVKD